MFLGVLDMSLRAPIDWYKLLGAMFKSQKVDLTPITLYRRALSLGTGERNVTGNGYIHQI